MTQTAAAAECAGLGARLPTVTELYRNNGESGSGDVGTANEVDALWTLITDLQGSAETVRLNDGGVTAFGPWSACHYRCIWPAAASASFDSSACHGPPGAECVNVRRFYNMDAWDRPALDMVAATHECNFVNGSIPMVEDWTDAIHSGALTGTWGNYLWGGDLMYTAGPSWLLHPIVQFDAPRAKHWAFDSTKNSFGGWKWPSDAVRFRCIGKRSVTEGVDPVSPACNGACFSIQGHAPQASGPAGRRSPIWADRANRPAANRAGAAQACSEAGGSLPTVLELQELIHAGLPFAAGEDVAWLWTSSPIYIGYYLNLLARRSTGADPRTWHAANPASVSWDLGDGYYAFRCVWHQTFQALPPSCGLDHEPSWDGTRFTCSPRADGDDSGNASGGGFHDRWGNAWDSDDRAATSLAEARESCALAGARLPTPTELYRVRQTELDAAPSPSVNYLWTTTPSYRLDFTVAERLSDGTVTDAADASGSLAFRCIWPASHGNVFGGGACNGDPGAAASPLDPCFRTGRHVSDRLDRPALYPASAAHECSFYGGFLTGLRSFEEIVHGGAPNGDFINYSWLAEPMFSSAKFYQGVARWSGTGTTGWYWNSQVTATAMLAGAESPNRYRCVFNDLLR